MTDVRRIHRVVLTRLGLGGGRAVPSGGWLVELPQPQRKSMIHSTTPAVACGSRGRWSSFLQDSRSLGAAQRDPALMSMRRQSLLQGRQDVAKAVVSTSLDAQLSNWCPLALGRGLDGKRFR